MAKFNEVQKKRRALAAERKRAVHGDALTGKLQIKQQPLSISGKRKRKLFKQWRREQKEALQKGLVTMQDVEMAVAGAGAGAEGETGTSEETKKASTRFHMKKSLKLKQLKRRGGGKKKQSKAKPATEAPLDSMVE